MFKYVIPTGSALIALAIIGIAGAPPTKRSASELRKTNPEEINLLTEYDYNLRASVYVARDEKEKALESCLEMPERFDNHAADRCQLDVYDAYDDVDNQIRIHEKWLQQKIDAGDSTVPTEYTLQELRDERDKKKK